MQLDELTQQNAALVEEASAASQSMAEQARSLHDTMARYTVAASQHRAAANPAKPTAARSTPSSTLRKPAGPGALRKRSADAPLPAPTARVAKATGTDDAVWPGVLTWRARVNRRALADTQGQCLPVGVCGAQHHVAAVALALRLRSRSVFAGREPSSRLALG